MSDDTRNRTREGHLPDLPDGELATFHGPKCIGRYRPKRTLAAYTDI